MHFHIHKRRQAPAVIIVALIDVLIVLLIFLMVTSTFRQQASLRLALPESTQAKKPGTTQTPPYIISIDEKGVLRLGPDAHASTLDQLKAELSSEIEKKPDLQVALSADKQAPLGEVIKVMDVAKEVHLKNPLNIFAKEAPKP
ncbi:MAG TPA: biopolymer transporter ExbD [Verrucomicrobiae bacterium]|nr:biopolymer transporter ExbD [Verrucomicrobiae bacterium]